MPVADELLPILDAMTPSADGPPGLDAIRDQYAVLSATLATPSPALATVEDRAVPGPVGPVSVRVYTPKGHGPFPVLVFFHGGAFFIGSVDTHDPVCRELAARSGWIVVSVEYRLAPKHPFPAAADDCFAALQWCASEARSFGGDPEQLAVGGDSAGGNLAAVVAQRARDDGGPDLRLQALIYPVTDAACDTPSMARNGEGYFLTADALRMMWNLYTPDAATRDNPHVSPFRAVDLAGVAPALVITAEFDPLVDEGEAYAKRLLDAGVPVELTRYDGMIHGFVQMLAVTPRAIEAIDQAAAALKRAQNGA